MLLGFVPCLDGERDRQASAVQRSAVQCGLAPAPVAACSSVLCCALARSTEALPLESELMGWLEASLREAITLLSKITFAPQAWLGDRQGRARGPTTKDATHTSHARLCVSLLGGASLCFC